MGPEKAKLVDHKCKSCDADISQDAQGHVCVSIQVETAPSDQMIGKVVHERYRILEPLSAGGWAKVYLAQHLSLGTKVAFKILNTDLAEQEDKRKRFEFEAQCASKIDHPNIGRIFDYGLFEGHRPFIVMELLSGSTLAEYLAEKVSMKPDEFKRIFSQLIYGITAAHAASLVHRDLKPSNVMFANANFEELKVKILDFGIAKSLDSSPESSSSHHLTNTGEILGTPAYMSPEQISGRKVDQRSDIYALACMMYECGSGKRPFEALNSFEVMLKHCQEDPKSIAPQLAERKYPSKLDSFILRCLNKNPDERFADSKEMHEAFEQVWQGTYSGKFPRAQKSKPKNKLVLAFAAIVLASVVPIVVYFSQDKDEKKDPAAQSTTAVAGTKANSDASDADNEPFVPKKKSKESTLVTNTLNLIKKQGGVKNALDFLNSLKDKAKTEEDKAKVAIQIGSLYELCLQPMDARRLYEKHLASLVKTYGANSSKLLPILWRIRRSYAESEEYAKAQEIDQRRLKILEANGINNPEEKSMFALNLVEDCLYQSKMEEAAAFLNTAELVIYAKSDKIPKLQEGYSFALKAHQSFRIHQDQDASVLANKAFEIASAVSESDLSAEVLETAAQIFDELKDRKMVGQCLRKAVHARRAANDDASDEMIYDCLRVAQNYAKRNLADGVIPYLKEFPKMAELRPGPPSKELEAGLKIYIKALNETGRIKESSDLQKQLDKLKLRPMEHLPAV